MASTPLINGRRFSFSSIEIALSAPGGSPELFVDVDDISYSEALEFEFKRGASQQPLGWTAGQYTPGDCTIQMGKGTFNEGIVQGIGPGWMGVNLALLIAYAEVGEVPIVDSMVARIKNVEDAGSAGPAALVTVVTLQPFMIIRNGVLPVLNRVI